MAPHGDSQSPLHRPKMDLSFDPKEREGLTTEEVEELYKTHGYNELPVIVVPLWYVFVQQFMGAMPYILEICIVLAAIINDWASMGIILCMLICNGCLGFHEELKAAASLAELTNKMEQKIPVLRDGAAEQMLTRLLVPGDVVLLMGGALVPADIDWLEGDILAVNTAALTGEPLPRKYPSEEHGKLILCGCTIQSGEAYGIVRKTGTQTEIGSASADIMKDKTTAKVSLFEQRILLCVKVIILASIVDVFIIFLQQGLGGPKEFQGGWNGKTEDGPSIKKLLGTCLSILIASVPIALPLVLQVTMALGAGKMATHFDAVVTSLPALQDISSMTVLCSDKTGTLTTAKITIHAESVWTCGDFSKQDVAFYAGLASNRDKKEDAIDRSVINHFDKVHGAAGVEKCKEYVKARGVGFNPIYKRVLFEFNHPKHGKITVSKGLPNKVLDTSDGGADDAEDQWKVKGYKELRDEVKKVDYQFSKAGYKTLGVVIKIGDGDWMFVGILPMLDPPRHDTAQTIKNLVNAGIEVKMITGDHLNIAKETARLIGMGQNIHPGESTRDGTQERNDLILKAHGFAQVLPKDKREVVLVLRDVYKFVVGMTGDGVNDAPALSAAQCGVAVDDATDAAKNAAAIILTSPGLSAIYAAVVESRRIFRKLKAYVTYRFAATIQIVVVLTLLIFISNCAIDSLYVVILALFNDLTMLPIAYDAQQASKMPENPDVNKLLIVATGLGFLGTSFSMLFAYGAGYLKGSVFVKNYSIDLCSIGSIDQTYRIQSAIWLQIFIAAELLIFSARAPSYFWVSIAPSPALFFSVMLGNVIASIMAGQSTRFGALPAQDICVIWAYDIICLLFIDVLKVWIYKFFNESTEVLPELVETGSVSDRLPGGGHKDHHEAGSDQQVSEFAAHGEDLSRMSVSASRMSNWASGHSGSAARASVSGGVRPSVAAALHHEAKNKEMAFTERISVSTSHHLSSQSNALRPSLTVGTLRPNVPSNRNHAR